MQPIHGVPLKGNGHMKKDALLKLWVESEPSARSAKSSRDAMWETLKDGDLTLFTRPGTTMTRPHVLSPYVEVGGVHYQWMRDGEWVGQACQATFEEFDNEGPAKLGIPPSRIGFDWAKRVSFPVLTLPFIEGIPSPDKAQALTRWIKDNSDPYRNSYVKMYHATCVSLPIEQEGLKPTSVTRRRSYQSLSGYVYLANTPERAKAFGDLGNGGASLVYEVVVPIRSLQADKDQLSNQRSVGHAIGDSLGESIVYGGGARVKGAIAPWAVRLFDFEKDLGPTHLLAERAERERRHAALSTLKNKSGIESTIWSVSQRMGTHSVDPNGFDWCEFEDAVISESLGQYRCLPEHVQRAILDYSPGAVGHHERESIVRRVGQWVQSSASEDIAPTYDSPSPRF